MVRVENSMKERMKRLYRGVATKQVEGIGVIEVILILVIIIGLVLIFREKITEIINSIFDSITIGTDDITK